ncbi:MAG: helix-turn-helix domain-containing protein [Verrucomicrobium sp.]|nr:helix-turn-helix domain-containing protein [Verrucomicrobium sp.]
MESVTVAGLLHALSDPVRIAIVAELLKEKKKCGVNCVQTMSRAKLSLPKSTCSQHYQILREAGIIFSERKGVELASRIRCEELEARFPGLLKSIIKAYQKEAKK